MLFGTSTTGKVKQWLIQVLESPEGAIIRTQHGYEGGKIQTADKMITQGKNIGRKNETTPLEQAIAEARSLWQKKCDDKYVPREEANKVVSLRAKAVDDDVPSPMLAHDYNKRGKNMQFPCFVQPKLDGTRMVAIPGHGLFSRNRKAYPHLEHIMEEISQLPDEMILDGELYSTTLTFQEIVGLVKNETRQPNQEQIKFHVYDIINDRPFSTRYEELKELFKRPFQHLVFVKTEVCATEEAMKAKHAEYVAEGYEGIMLRNPAGRYANNRSVHLQKYKEFFDTECEIVGFTEGDGLEKGCVIWTCITDEGKPFSCRPRGSREERQELFEMGDDYIGKMLTVRYQEKTDDGLLRFPVGIAIRDYE
jgi:ATP-dependent DNA ligase